jgi:hypothetical protein
VHSYKPEAADISGPFGRYGFIAYSCKADVPELSRDSHPVQHVDTTILSTVIAMPALSKKRT